MFQDQFRTCLEEKVKSLFEADIQYLPSIEVETLEENDLQKLAKLIDVLENDDDVQKVHHNFAGDL